VIETKSIERVVRMAVRRLFVVVFVFVQMPVHAQADRCSKTGYTVGFFNGVWNTILTATDSTQLVAGVIGEKYEEEPIEYRVFHNETGSENDSTMGQDVAEVSYNERMKSMHRASWGGDSNTSGKACLQTSRFSPDWLVRWAPACLFSRPSIRA